MDKQMYLSKNTIILLAVVVSGIVVWSFLNNSQFFSMESIPTTKSSMKGSIFGVTKQSKGEVIVELTPEKFVEGRLFATISVSTHNVDDLHKYDLKEITTLELGDQNIKPVSAPNLRGHHSKDKLVFEVGIRMCYIFI